MRVVRSIALYASPIWAETMDKKSYRIEVDEAYRKSALSFSHSIYRRSLGDCGNDAATNVSRSREEKIFDK